MVCLVIIGVITACAAPSFGDLVARLTLRHATDRLVGTLEAARAIAAARRVAVWLTPHAGAVNLDGGWQLVLVSGNFPSPIGRDSAESAETILLSVTLHSPCLQIALHGTDDGNTLHISGMGYSPSERGGFYAGSFLLRCGALERLVRLGSMGQLRVCTPAIDPACETGEKANIGPAVAPS